MSRMRVLHCITDLSPDGAQRTLLRLLGSLDRTRFDSRVVCLKNGGSLASQFEAEGFDVTGLGMHRGIPGVTSLFRLRSIIREWRPHLVQGWMYHGNVAALMATRMSGCAASTPVVWNVRRCLYDLSQDRFGTRWTIRAGARLSRCVAKIIYCVDLAALQHEEIGFDAERRIVIPNGIDVRKFKPMGSGRELLRDELGLSDDALVVGAVGRYHPQKDFGCFLRAAASVVWGGVDAHFVLAGRGVDSSNHELMSLASELGIEERLHLLGERQDVSSVMSGLDLFVSSSENEGFSNVLGEAMACGIPCVATDVGAAAEVLAGIGQLVPVGEPLVLGATISQTLALPPERRAVIGLRCRMRIQQSYSAAGMGERYAHLYHTLTEAPPAVSFEEACRMAA